MADVTYRPVVQSAALRSLGRIPERYAWALLRFIGGPLAWSPRRVGKALGLELTGWRVARIEDYRIVYWIDEAEHTVVVERIEHRADVYRPR